MATTLAINAGLDVILKSVTALHKIKNEYNQATREIQAFTDKEDTYREQVRQWKELMRKYPLPPDHSVIACVNKAAKDLDKQVQLIQNMEKSNSCCRFWIKTWSCESLIARLMDVEKAFKNISDFLQQKQQAEQAIEQEADKCRAPFSFAADKKYVPITKTVKRIRRALESDGSSPKESDGSSPKVVLLHGGSGEGKSTLVKYMALHYDHEKTNGASSSCNSCRFSDGVIFLSCGKNPDSLSLMRQLSADLGYSHDASQVRFQMDGDRKRELELLKKRLVDRLKNGKRIMIIVDDVWEQELIADLMMPLKDVTYLITSQRKTIWQDADECLSIDSPSVEEARQILANHIVGWNCKPFPPEVQGEVDLLIEKVQGHPLVLANLAAQIKCEQVLCRETWIQLRNELMNAIRRADRSNDVSKPTVFRKPYESKLVASLTMAISLIDDNAKSLLSALALCAGGVDVKVLRLWFKVLHGPSMYMFNSTYTDLREHSLISIVKKTGRKGKARTTCSIHDLRREFIREYHKGVLEDTLQKLIGCRGTEAQVSSDGSDEDLAAALCFAYADVKYTQNAQGRIQIHEYFLQSDNEYTRDFMRAAATLLHSAFEDACAEEMATHELAKTVILHYLQFHEFQDETLQKFRDFPQAFQDIFFSMSACCVGMERSKIPMTIGLMVILHYLQFHEFQDETLQKFRYFPQAFQDIFFSMSACCVGMERSKIPMIIGLMVGLRY